MRGWILTIDGQYASGFRSKTRLEYRRTRDINSAAVFSVRLDALNFIDAVMSAGREPRNLVFDLVPVYEDEDGRVSLENHDACRYENEVYCHCD